MFIEGQVRSSTQVILLDVCGRFVKELDGGVAEKAQLGLGHSYSRAKVKDSSLKLRLICT